MEAWEVLVSESQERMRALVDPARLADVLEVCRRWEILATVLGTMTPGDQLRVRFRGEVVAEVPAASLADDGPVYERPMVRPTVPGPGAAAARVPLDLDPAAAVLALAGDPTCASKRWVWEQYDRFVGHATVAGPGCDAAVVRVPGAAGAVALATDGNGRFAALDPAAGAALAVAEAARNVACTGARPIAVTNCLNFASPERPEVMGTFAAAVDGMAGACRALGLPVTGGNVSFYNESSGRPIHPTPIVGVLGLLDDATTAVPSGFPRPGLEVWLLGETRAELGGSVWQRLTTGRLEGPPPALDLAAEARLHRLLADLAERRLVAAAHDLSDGGLAVALVEATLAAGVGATLDLPPELSPLAALVSESPSRVLLAVPPEAAGELASSAAKAGVPARHLGATGGDRLVVGEVVDLPLSQLGDAYESALPRALGDPA
jgi:phosphoribosylformylglycinamidine synthase